MSYATYVCISHIPVKFHISPFSSFCAQEKLTSILTNFQVYEKKNSGICRMFNNFQLILQINTLCKF